MNSSCLVPGVSGLMGHQEPIVERKGTAVGTLKFTGLVVQC